MRRGCSWIGWALCLCASLTASAREHDAGVESANDDVFLDVMHEDSKQPGTGTVPAAPLIRCNKVRRVAEGL